MVGADPEYFCFLKILVSGHISPGAYQKPIDSVLIR